MAIIKMTPPPPNCRIQDVTFASPACTFEWFIHIILISMPVIHKTLWLVKEAGGGGGGGGGVKILWPIIK